MSIRLKVMPNYLTFSMEIKKRLAAWCIPLLKPPCYSSSLINSSFLLVSQVKHQNLVMISLIPPTSKLLTNWDSFIAKKRCYKRLLVGMFNQNFSNPHKVLKSIWKMQHHVCPSTPLRRTTQNRHGMIPIWGSISFSQCTQLYGKKQG